MIQLRTRLPDTPHGRATVLTEAVLIPVAEALAPRMPVAVLGRGPVPALGIRAGYVKSANRGAVVEEHAELALCRQTHADARRIVLGFLPFHRLRRIYRHHVHRL